MKDKKIIDRLIKLLEATVNLRGSPKGYGTSHPIPAKNEKQGLGKSNYPLEDQPDETPKAKKIKVSKHLKNKEEDDNVE